MQKPIILLNFTHAYEGMDFLRAMPCQWVDCTHLHGTQCYCDSEGERRLRALLAPYPPEGIHLIDSGDYHYVTKLWTDKIDHPFSLIVFDHHPDMQPPLFEGLLSCGCWVRTVLDTNPHVQKVCIVGATEKLKQETAGYDGRLVYFSEQTLRLREAWHVFSRLWLNEPVYISIDKDAVVWQKALEEEQLPWRNFRDETGVADAYSVSAIPAIFLVDGSGTIIATGLRGTALQEKLETLLP